MLDHLHIQNYRLFKDLKIDKLGQVNLIAGKNNTGKTALLEALRIWKSKGDYSVFSNILSMRNQYDDSDALKSFSSLFNDFNYENLIQIYYPADFVNFKIESIDNKYINEFFLQTEKGVHKVGSILGNSEFPRDELIYLHFLQKFYPYENLIDKLDVEKEDEIIKILNIIEPKIRDFRPSLKDKQPLVRVQGKKDRLPLKFFGDGANRIFIIALALVNAKNNILIIDEFEVGLHHSVQEQLWDIIFKYAKEWNIQVFVTTHSQDTVKAFAEVWNQSEENIKMGNYFRLQRSRENPELIEPIYYDNEMLEFAYQKHIETR